MLTIERVAALRRVPLFSGVPDHVLAGVARVAVEVPVAPGEVVIELGDEDETMFVVVDGTLRVDAGGHTLTELGPGTSFGELSLLAPGPRSATVTVTTPGVLLRLDRPTFEELMVDHPELARSAIRMLVELVRDRTPGGARS